MSQDEEKAPLSTIRISVADMMALHVRTRELKNPHFFYQALPLGAMSLMATIPRGDFAVSIPHRSDWGGYPIVKSRPPTIDGFALLYARQPNGRYEAVHALFEGRTFGIAQFHEIARGWVEMHDGCLKPIPGRYAYFAPTRKTWGVILRDEGYAALDPSRFSPDFAPVGEKSPKSLNGGIVARVAVQRGEKQGDETVAPVFAQVELTLGSPPGRRNSWISFVQYQSARIFRSHPPSSIVSDFKEWLKVFTQESGFESWVFRPGMFFGDRIEWWGHGNRRRSEHEGLDFAEGLPPGGPIRNIPEKTPVRALADGEIVAILADFLDKTVVVRHGALTRESGDVFYTLYSHIHPAAPLSGPVVKGQLLGKVGKSTTVRTPAHFHLAGAWFPTSIAPKEIRMDQIDQAFVPVVLANFNELVQDGLRRPGKEELERLGTAWDIRVISG